MILTPEILTLLILNSIFLIFGFIVFYLSIKIFLKWDKDSTSTLQYTLEKQSTLSATIIKYIFMIKLPLFLFFIFTLDKLSDSIPGAMCAVGVVDAMSYGNYLLILKIINIYLFGFWLTMDYYDKKSEHQPYTKQKFSLYIFAFILFFIEIIVEFIMFLGIDPNQIVNCCGTLYSSSANSYISNIFLIQKSLLLYIFYGTYILLVLFAFLKQKYLFTIFNIIFLIIALISLISFFGTYIYELPTHHCPFCILQKDYNYVGYLLYSILFIGTFYGTIAGFKSNQDKAKYNVSLIFNLLYIIIVSAYPILYYIKNSVWL